MKSWIVHYQNKYPGGQVKASDSAIDVYNADGEHVVALRRNGAGQFVCVSEEYGCKDRHDLSPIPRDARVRKLCKDGCIRDDEEAEKRRPKQAALAAHKCGGRGKVPSEKEISEYKEEEVELVDQSAASV